MTTKEQFVKMWQAAPSLGAVASKIGNGKAATQVRAARLRADGVPLKKMSPHRRVEPVNPAKALKAVSK